MTKPTHTTYPTPEDQENHTRIVDALTRGIIGLADMELRRYPDIEATKALRAVEAGAGSLGFSAVYTGGSWRLLMGLMHDGAVVVELMNISLDPLPDPGEVH
ncbi:MAG: hypothetical protein BGO13_00205 [Burkholderiales bacterium 66-5]|nr:MAG: hypothetical protein BGO13_00205 [Burkholderiales bacterium 66-5]